MKSKGDKKLVMISSENNNKFYNMHDNGDGTFTVEWGRIGLSSQKTNYPISKWDRTYRNKTKKGYKDITDIYAESSTVEESDFIDVKDPKIKGLIRELQTFANSSVENNYMVTSNSVTQKQIDEAQNIIDNIVNSTFNDPSDLNDILIELYSVIPRKMNKVSNYLFSFKNYEGIEFNQANINKVIQDEQATLDVMRGQVQTIQTSNESDKKQTLLDAMGLIIEDIDDNDIANIEILMGPNWKQFNNGFRVTNKKTEDKFNNYIHKNSFSSNCELFWHGSRNENWWSILDSGLVLRPSNAIITGKMFGYGIYFADKCQKSVNYTSLKGSYWARGSQNKGYISLFNVNTGNWLHAKEHKNWMYDLNESKLKERGNYDSLFAEGGIDLRNNEYIVYNQDQVTIKYIVEIQ